MFTSADLTAGTARLESGKLKASDVTLIVTILRKYFKHLETLKGYTWRSDYEEVDDTGNDEKVAATIAAALNKLESFGFGSAASLQGGADAIFFKEKDRYWEYVEIIFTQLYPMPEEMGPNGVIRRISDGRKSQSICTRRREIC